MSDRKFTPPTTFPAEYVTREGRKAVIMGTMPSKDYPYVGYVKYPHTALTSSWASNGDQIISSSSISDLFDIPPEPKKVVQWGNDYGSARGCWYDSREKADYKAYGNRIAVIRREWPEGGKPEYFREDV